MHQFGANGFALFSAMRQPHTHYPQFGRSKHLPSAYADYGTRPFWGSLLTTPQYAIGLLWKHEIYTPDELCEHTEDQILVILMPLDDPKVARYALDRIKADLEFNGRKLAD